MDKVIRAPDLYPKRRSKMFTAARDKFLLENRTVDPILLAEALGLSERSIYVYQRKLGIRLCTASRRANHKTGD